MLSFVLGYKSPNHQAFDQQSIVNYFTIPFIKLVQLYLPLPESALLKLMEALPNTTSLNLLEIYPTCTWLPAPT